jgi:hypothetical protein
VREAGLVIVAALVARARGTNHIAEARHLGKQGLVPKVSCRAATASAMGVADQREGLVDRIQACQK